jgi:DNA repair exonuclease SbcCD ATPase subunit
MEAELNQLFEEAVTRSRELTDAAEAALTAVDEAARRARDVAERVEENGTRAGRHLREVAEQLERDASAIGDARHETEASLASLADRASGLEEEVGGLLERVRTASGTIDEQRLRLDDSLEAQRAEVEADVAELGRHAGGVATELEERLERAQDATMALRSSLDAARAELARTLESWSEVLNRLEGNARAGAGQLVEAIQELLGRQATAMVQAANVMVERHNAAMALVKSEFAEEVPAELSTSLQPLHAALGATEEEAVAREQDWTSEVEALDAAMTAGAPARGDVRTALEGAAVLG